MDFLLYMFNLILQSATHKYSNYLCYNNKVPIWHEMDKVG